MAKVSQTLTEIISLLGLIFIRAPSMQDLTFSSEANFEMSAGFGPNQVSTLLGVSLVIVSIARMFNLKIFPSVLAICETSRECVILVL